MTHGCTDCGYSYMGKCEVYEDGTCKRDRAEAYTEVEASTGGNRMTELDEFLRIYNRELENKERQLWECLSLKYDPHSLVRDMADGKDAKAERERCENELFDWKNKKVKVRYIYTKEAERKFVAQYDGMGVEIKETYSPEQKYGRCVIEKQSEVEKMSREGFPLYDGEKPSDFWIDRWFADTEA